MAATPLPPDQNGTSLRRLSDRVQDLMARLLLIALLVVVPAVSAGLGVQRFDAGVRTGQAQAASRHRVTAHLLDSAPVLTANGALVTGPEPVSAGWTTADHHLHTTIVQAAPGRSAGTPVTLWTAPDGSVTGPPLTRHQAAESAWLLVGEAELAGTALCLLLWKTCRLALDRHRYTRWEAEWALVEPQWTRGRPKA